MNKESEKGALALNRQLCLGQWQWTRKGLCKPRKFTRKGGAKGRVRLFKARGSAELEQVVSGFSTQGLLSGNQKSRISGNNRRRRLPARETVEKLGEEEEEPATEQRR